MTESGMMGTFKDLFEHMDEAGKGYITQHDFFALFSKLGLPEENATALGRVIGIDVETMNLDQFTKVLALALHEPYVRLSQHYHGEGKIEEVSFLLSWCGCYICMMFV